MLKLAKDYSTFRDVIKGRLEDNKFTPDAHVLDEYEFQLFFAHDQLQRNMTLYPMIEESAYLCSAFTTKNFQFFKSAVEPDGIPIPMETELTEPLIRNLPFPAKIKGELHIIRPKQFLPLDIMLKNGVQFTRKRVRLIVPYRERRLFPTKDVHGRPLPKVLQGKEGLTFWTNEKVYIIRAWMYVGNPDYWNDLLDVGYHFQSVKMFEPKQRTWLKRYYKYTRDEYK